MAATRSAITRTRQKTDSTFKIVDGVRMSIPGDHAIVEADGSLRLLGRGSVCINTGGEKVFPEEVEEVLKLHPMVRDAVVVGIPDDRFGQAITAVVELETGAVHRRGRSHRPHEDASRRIQGAATGPLRRIDRPFADRQGRLSQALAETAEWARRRNPAEPSVRPA